MNWKRSRERAAEIGEEIIKEAREEGQGQEGGGSGSRKEDDQRLNMGWELVGQGGKRPMAMGQGGRRIEEGGGIGGRRKEEGIGGKRIKAKIRLDGRWTWKMEDGRGWDRRGAE